MAIDDNFVDTSAWFELLTHNDAARGAAMTRIWTLKRYRFVTSDFVIDELLTLLRGRGYGWLTRNAWNLMNDRSVIRRIEHSTGDMEETYSLFEKFDDKEWSFTDCSSYLFIRRYNIQFASAFNGHFHEFGIVTVLP